MKTDWKLLIAVFVLIGLVLWLIVVSQDRSNQVDQIRRTLETIKKEQKITAVPQNGRTPVVGVDFPYPKDGKNALTYPPPKDGINGTNGLDSLSTHTIKQLPAVDGKSAYELALSQGFVGSLKEWLEQQRGPIGLPGPSLQMECVDGRWNKKLSTDLLWQTTNVKCEVL